MQEEVLDTGPRRQLPRWVAGVAVLLLVAAVVVAIALRDGGDGSEQAAPSSPPSTISAPVFPGAPLSTTSGPFGPSSSLRAQLLRYVYERALDGEPAHDTILNDTSTSSCEQVPDGPLPSLRIRLVTLKAFSRLKVRDIARTIDKFAGLCVVELRAGFDEGTALVVRIVAPTEDTDLVQMNVFDASQTLDSLQVRVVQVRLRSGWVVTVGTSGPAISGPSERALEQFAMTSQLLW